jgi:hypothetical protein
MATKDMKALFEGVYAPTTFTIGFFEAPLETCVAGMKRWYSDIKRVHASARFEGQNVESVLSLLSPLSMPWYREVFLQTQSPWTAYLNNAIPGTDLSSVTTVLSQRLGIRSLGIRSIPSTLHSDYGPGAGTYGAITFHLRAPQGDRAVELLQDGGSYWRWYEEGTPLPFEETASYTAKRRTERFTTPMLLRYCAALGLDLSSVAPFGGSACLFDSTPQQHPPQRVLSVAEARAFHGLT